jgi:hypothetical protein
MGRQIEVEVVCTITVDTIYQDEEKASERAKEFAAAIFESWEDPAGFSDIEVVFEPECTYSTYNRGVD